MLVSCTPTRVIRKISRYVKRGDMHVKRHQFVLFPELHWNATFNVNIGRYDVIDKRMNGSESQGNIG